MKLSAWFKDEVMSTWQSIETAPTDGRKIIVSGGYFYTNDQSLGMRVDPDGCEVFTSKVGRFFLDDTTMDQIRNATHWRELNT